MIGKTKNDATAFLQSVAHMHVASNCRRYSYKVMLDEASHSTALGFQVDQKPAEGKVIAVNDSWVIVKTGRTEFFVGLRDMMRSTPEVDETVCITPYHRRRFDSKPVGAPEESVSNGIRVQTFALGDSNSRIPLDKDSLQSTYLREMVNQIEHLPTGDGFRNLGNALVDAGGDSPALLGYKDPSDADCVAVPPSLEFAVKTKKFEGSIVLSYDRGMDYYFVTLMRDGEVVKRIDDVDFTSLGQVVVDLIDDGEWKIADVKVLKKAPKKKAA